MKGQFWVLLFVVSILLTTTSCNTIISNVQPGLNSSYSLLGTGNYEVTFIVKYNSTQYGNQALNAFVIPIFGDLIQHSISDDYQYIGIAVSNQSYSNNNVSNPNYGETVFVGKNQGAVACNQYSQTIQEGYIYVNVVYNGTVNQIVNVQINLFSTCDIANFPYPSHENEPCINSGDTGWVLLATILVLGMMPALAFFEAGLLRRKNTLSIITEVIVGLATMELLWYFGGFSLVYGPDHWGLIGGFEYFFLLNLPPGTCLHFAERIPGLAFASFQSMFAAVTPLLMTGAVAERMKFRSFLLFIVLWEIIVYYPLAHWIWGGGFLDSLGVADFAGGIVIHTSAGTSSFILATFLGRRLEFEKYHGEFPPHNIPLATIGTALLWMGWYGFNAGSALAAGSVASYAISATTIASCVGAITWSILSMIKSGRVHTVAVLNGAIAGMAGITPVSGYIQSYWAFIIAVIICVCAWIGVIVIKEKLRIDDALDVSSVHGITGIVGALSIGFVASSAINPKGPDGWFYHDHWQQIFIQLAGVLVAMIWSGVWTAILLFLFRFSKFFKLTVETEIESLGLDHYYHGNVAYVDLESHGMMTEENGINYSNGVHTHDHDDDERRTLRDAHDSAKYHI